ncbi:acyl carrier protein [Pseudobutyrivibrio ruminis]|uniref:acyl carrier protein n=1 Tax=Pseudobutyrivibrio ruminis TaxID=46206 RepID=UPI00040F0169|nr:acyl carrier protein [Pseudobutyrivibrio ruminis]
MNRNEVLNKIQELVREILDDEEIELSEKTMASDIDGWDSLMHITIISAIEDEFNVKFAMRDIMNMKNVGAMIDLILSKS